VARAAVLRDPQVIVGASDGAHLDMIATFNYTTRLISTAVRDLGLRELKVVVRLLTSAPTEFYGFGTEGDW